MIFPFFNKNYFSSRYNFKIIIYSLRKIAFCYDGGWFLFRNYIRYLCSYHTELTTSTNALRRIWSNTIPIPIVALLIHLLQARLEPCRCQGERSGAGVRLPCRGSGVEYRDVIYECSHANFWVVTTNLNYIGTTCKLRTYISTLSGYNKKWITLVN